MSVLPFESIFKGFSDPSQSQPYDEPGTSATKVDEIKQSYRPLLDQLEEDIAGNSHAGIHQELSGFLAELKQDTNEAVAKLVSHLIPSEEITANVEFQIENDSGQIISSDDLLESLRTANYDQNYDLNFRVANYTLEQNFQALLDHLTARRISEEMDAPTYVERLRGSVKRVHDGSLIQADKLEVQKEAVDRAMARLETALDLITFSDDATVRPTEEPGQPKRSNATSARQFIENSIIYVEKLQRFMEISVESLRNVQNKFCAASNVAGIEGESILISRETERHALFRPLPFIWALTNTVLVKVILAHNTSETLHYQAVPLLILTFLLTWMLSIYFGISGRTRRMRKLKDYTRHQLRSLLRATDKKNSDIGFPRIGKVSVKSRNPAFTTFAFRGKAVSNKRKVAAYNLWALIIPALIAAIVIITRKEVEHDFIARFPSTEPCVLASGHLVFATSSSYFVQPSNGDVGLGTWLINKILPEINADVVDRENIISIRKFVSADNSEHVQTTLSTAASKKGAAIAEESLLKSRIISQRLRDCATNDPDHNTYDLIHRGNAFGVFGSEVSTNHFLENAENLVAAIDSLGAIEINLHNDIIPTTVDPIVVTPIINETTTTDATLISPVAQSFFQTSFALGGDASSKETIENSLILPFFSSPVQSDLGSISTPSAAFKWGAALPNLKDPIIPGQGVTYFNRIANVFQSCMAGGGTIELDVIGLSSRSWAGRTEVNAPNILNYYLAEGRRLGALRTLGSFIQQRDQQSRLIVQTSNGTASLADILSEDSIHGSIDLFVENFGRFENTEHFQKGRNELVAMVRLNKNKISPLEELFGRSVVLKVMGADGEACRF